ncbi:biotin-dependent carboxyltransferase family protein [Salipaludibacillus sp. LMS25]|jgi:antagonist of KipI|uniref:5-oxoprolinase subunit C family protein n=1 Tax=Salipaludibacillus sp. LMS25 TaxID=2924031 RepID=UPI0020D01577|nr:biotin-dependent carboxyltransferase family protein [Salipaludibacillus sp. LMS25]UTR16349.1 biotin-dependent carboxyltransferase family protein [Salipaludibacillus sp. LMS25]
MIPLIKVEESGLHTTIQDSGRYGHQEYGIVPSGPMDPFAFKMANLLAGNKLNEAAIEMTMIGPSLTFLEDTVMAVAGAHLSPTVDNKKIPMWTSVLIHKGQTLRFGKPKYGARAYLAIAGGMKTDKVLGSRSTHTKSRLGGIKGEVLETGDVVPGIQYDKSELYKWKGKSLAHSLRPVYQSHHMVRVIPDVQETFFKKEDVSTFYTHSYKITPQSDRMGYRLTGRKIKREVNEDILSEAVAFGSIQIPSDGNPIVLMADRQTTGGYPKIGTVIHHDLWKVAQLLPGQTLSFQREAVEEGHRWQHYEENLFKKLQMARQRI